MPLFVALFLLAAAPSGTLDGGGGAPLATGMLCIDTSIEPDDAAMSAPQFKGLSGAFSFRIDDGPWILVPDRQGVKLDGVAAGAHRLSVKQGGRPYETATFEIEAGRVLTVKRGKFRAHRFSPRREPCPFPAPVLHAPDGGTSAVR